MNAEYEAVQSCILNRATDTFSGIPHVVQAIELMKEDREGFTERLVEFDQTLQTMKGMMSGMVAMDPLYHRDVKLLQENHLSYFPPLAYLSHASDYDKNAEVLIDAGLRNVRTKIESGHWSWVNDITESHQVATRLLLEGYGSMLETELLGNSQQGIHRVFVRAFEEILWTQAKPWLRKQSEDKVIELKNAEIQNTKLLDDLVFSMVKERDDFPLGMSTELHAIEGRTYGDTVAFGDSGSILELPAAMQALIAAKSDACPVGPDVVSRRGAEAARRRYFEINFWRRLMFDQVKEQNPQLYLALTAPLTRLGIEPMSKHTPGWPPQDLEQEMYAASGPYGFAFPRLLITFINHNIPPFDETNPMNPLNSDIRMTRQERLKFGLKGFDYAISNSSTLPELLVYFTEYLVDYIIPELPESDGASAYLKHMLGQGLLDEQNCRAEYRRIVQAMQTNAPTLTHFYRELTPAGRTQLGIADVPVTSNLK